MSVKAARSTPCVSATLTEPLVVRDPSDAYAVSRRPSSIAVGLSVGWPFLLIRCGGALRAAAHLDHARGNCPAPVAGEVTCAMAPRIGRSPWQSAHVPLRRGVELGYRRRLRRAHGVDHLLELPLVGDLDEWVELLALFTIGVLEHIVL